MPSGIAGLLAMGLYNLITYFGRSGTLDKAEENKALLKELYAEQVTPEIAVWLAKGLYQLIFAFKRNLC